MKTPMLGKSVRFLSFVAVASMATISLVGVGLPASDAAEMAQATVEEAHESTGQPIFSPPVSAQPQETPPVSTQPQETPPVSAQPRETEVSSEGNETPSLIESSNEPVVKPESASSLEQEQGQDGAYMGIGAAAERRAQNNAPAKPFAATTWKPAFGVLGLDVSGHQPNVNWATEAAKGAKFAYVKASEGITMTSDYFSSQYSGARNVGLIRGAYHFALPSVSSGTVQADFFVNNGGGWSADGWTLPPLLDIEYNPYGSLGNSCFNMSSTQMINWIRAFSDRVKARTGRLPMIYTTSDWWRTCTANNATFGANGLHIAAYNTRGPEPLPAGWSDYQMWQFSDAGPFSGDSNVWKGSLEQLKQFAVKADGVSTTAVGDINGDGANDLVSVRGDGGLWFHAGTGGGHFAPGYKIGSGWNVYSQLVGPGDINGDGRNDLLGVRGDGSLWFYSGTGTVDARSSGYDPGRKLGASIWNQYTRIVAVRDANSDGKNDLAASRSDGTLWLFPGVGSVTSLGNGFGAPVKVGTSSWDNFKSVSGEGDLNSDGIPDIVASRADGTLWFYAGTGATNASVNTYSSATKIGTSGWNQFQDILGTGDLNGDGKPDLVGLRPDGVRYFYAGTGMRDNGYNVGRQIGASGWNSFRQVLSAGDLDSDGVPDLIAIGHDGALWQYPGDGSGGYKQRLSIGNSWNVFLTVIGAGDLNGDSKPDLLAIRPDGTLWFYAGTGSISAQNSGYAPALKIGTYWNSFTDVIAVGDMNSDGKSDLVASRSDGSLWFYAGVGTVSSNNNGFAVGRNLGTHAWVKSSKLVGSRDFDGDGKSDVLSVDRAGALWFRGGTGNFVSGTGTKPAVKIGGSGWDAYGTLFGIGDANQNGTNDLVGINKNGSLWFYSGTGMRTAAFAAGVNGGTLR